MALDPQRPIRPPIDVSVLEDNASMTLVYDASAHLIQVDRVSSGTTYRKLLTWVGDNLTAIGLWIRV